MQPKTLPAAALVAALAAALPGAVAAQTPPELIGLSAAAATTRVVRQDWTDCTTTGCATLLAAPTAANAGGTAYDATRGVVWIANGLLLEAVDPVSCRVVCGPQSLPATGAGVRITGLAVVEAAGVMLVAASDNSILEYRLACPISTLVRRCDATPALPSGHSIGGIATDDVGDLVAFSSSDFQNPAAPGNVIHVARRGAPCSPICRIPVPACGTTRLGPLTGVAFDPCRNVLWATDGSATVGLRIGGPALCGPVQQVQCCDFPGPGRFVGLAVAPSRATAVGTNCTSQGCPNCPQMAHRSVGDAALGNPSFALELVNAPAGARVAMWINAGPCNPGGPIVPPFCGPVLVPIAPPPVVVSLGTGPGLGCSGAVQVPLPIPLDPALCGGVLSSQCFGICTTGLVGTFVSNCLSWQVTGS